MCSGPTEISSQLAWRGKPSSSPFLGCRCGSCIRSGPPFVVSSWAKEGTTLWITFLSEPSAPFCWALFSPGFTIKFSIQSSFWLLLNLFTISDMHILDSPIQLLTYSFIHSHILLFSHSFIHWHIHTYLLNWPLHVGHCRDRGERWIGSVWNPGLSALAKGIGQTRLPSPIHLCSAGGSQAKCFSNINVCRSHLGILLNKRFCFSSYGWGLHDRSLRSCSTLCDPMDCSLPDSFVHGILQARILKWIAMPSSRGSSRTRDRTQFSCIFCTADGFFTIETLGSLKMQHFGQDSR